jgi:hypothetical protein
VRRETKRTNPTKQKKKEANPQNKEEKRGESPFFL